MRYKIVLYILFITTVVNAQLSTNEQLYNGFASRSFLKYNKFLTAPTFSILNKNNTTVSVFARNTNIGFKGAPRLYLATFSGKIMENMGAGVAVYQQEANIFKDVGAVANYAYQIQLERESNLAFGFNLLYSRRGADANKVESSVFDPVLENFQPVSVINVQPAITYANENFGVGVFFENLVDYNMKKSEMITSFSEKTISLHAMYTYGIDSFRGFFEDATVKGLAVVRKQMDGVGFALNVIAELPKIGWLKAGYDKNFGILAEIGVSLSRSIDIGFAYELSSVAGTGEVGLAYNFGETKKRRRRTRRTRTSTIKTKNIGTKKKPIKKKQLTKKVIVNDTIGRVIVNDTLRRVIVNDTLRTVVRDTVRIVVRDTLRTVVKDTSRTFVRDTSRIFVRDTLRTFVNDTLRIKEEEKDTSLKRRTNTPWREASITREGGGGTMYYVAVDQFRDSKRVQRLIQAYEKRKVRVRYIKDPKTNLYYVYVDRFAKEEDAKELESEVNGGKRGFENKKEVNDLGIRIKEVSKDPVYVVKVTLGGAKETYKEPKVQRPARVRTMKAKGVEKGYYLVVNVFSQKAYADKFLDELRADNINANYFINPKTGYRHVYLLKTNSRDEIIKLYKNNLNKQYYDPKNIIHVK